MSIAGGPKLTIRSKQAVKREGQGQSMPPNVSNLSDIDVATVDKLLEKHNTALADMITQQHAKALSDTVSRVSDELKSAIVGLRHDTDKALASMSRQTEELAAATTTAIEKTRIRGLGDWLAIVGVPIAIVSVLAGVFYVMFETYKDTQATTLAAYREIEEQKHLAFQQAQANTLRLMETRMTSFEQNAKELGDTLVRLQEVDNANSEKLNTRIDELYGSIQVNTQFFIDILGKRDLNGIQPAGE